MATSLVRAESPSKAEEKPARHGMQAQPCAELTAKQDLQKNFSISSSEDQRYANPPTGVGNANLAAARGDVTTGSAAATSSNGAARVLGNWADYTEDQRPGEDDDFTVVRNKRRRRDSPGSPTAAKHHSNPRGAGANSRPRSSTGWVPRAEEIKTTRAHIAEARARQASSAEDNCVYVEYIPELEPYHYIRAVDRMIGGTNNVFQVFKINGHYLMGLNNRSLAERLISEGLEVEGTLFRAFPFRKRAMKITVGNLPFFVEDFTIISALTPYGRVTSIAPKLMKAGPYIYNDGRRDAFIVLHEGVTTERLPTRLEIKIKGEVWPAYLSYGIRCSRCHGQGHRRANCPLLAGRSNAPRPATPTSPTGVPPVTTPRPPQPPSAQPPPPASPSPSYQDVDDKEDKEGEKKEVQDVAVMSSLCHPLQPAHGRTQESCGGVKVIVLYTPLSQHQTILTMCHHRQFIDNMVHNLNYRLEVQGGENKQGHHKLKEILRQPERDGTGTAGRPFVSHTIPNCLKSPEVLTDGPQWSPLGMSLVSQVTGIYPPVSVWVVCRLALFVEYNVHVKGEVLYYIYIFSEDQRYANPPTGVGNANLAAARGDVTTGSAAATSSNGAARVLGNWADYTEDQRPGEDDDFTVVRNKRRRRDSPGSPTAAKHHSNPRGAGANSRPRSSTGWVPRAEEIKTTRAHIAEARARQASSAEDNCVYVEYIPELEPYHYIRAVDRMIGGTNNVFQVSKINGHYLMGLNNRSLAERLISEGLEVEGTLFRAFPFRKRAMKITVGNLPFFVEDFTIISALTPYGRVTSIAPKLMKAGPYIYNDGRRDAFIVLHEGVTTERLPTRLEIKIKGEVWPAYLSYGIRCSRCHGQGHRRANCPLLAGRSNAPRPATPTSPTGVPPVTTPRPPQPPSAQPPPPASPSPAMEVSEVPSTSRAALHPPAAPRQSPPVAPAIPTEMAPPAPPPVTPAPSLRAPGSHGPAVPTLDVEMSIEEISTSSTSSSGTSTREGLVTFLERNPGVSFAQTDALGLGREEVLDLLSSKTKARKRGPLLSPSQGDALAGLIRQLLGLKPGGNSNIYKVLGQ
ncbi:hypothetical protein LAZ67_3003039, partial [Cordylochernes scorpioides]